MGIQLDGRLSNRTFWTVCLVWALGVFSVSSMRSPGTVEVGSSLSEPEPRMPEVGDVLELPPYLRTVDGRHVPAVVPSDHTLYLVTLASCVISRAEAVHYHPELLAMAHRLGFTTRVMVVPSPSDHETVWLLEQFAARKDVVLDSIGFTKESLRVHVAPSAILLDSKGSVVAAFVPSDEWPVTEGMLRHAAGSEGIL